MAEEIDVGQLVSSASIDATQYNATLDAMEAHAAEVKTKIEQVQIFPQTPKGETYTGESEALDKVIGKYTQAAQAGTEYVASQQAVAQASRQAAASEEAAAQAGSAAAAAAGDDATVTEALAASKRAEADAANQAAAAEDNEAKYRALQVASLQAALSYNEALHARIEAVTAAEYAAAEAHAKTTQAMFNEASGVGSVATQMQMYSDQVRLAGGLQLQFAQQAVDAAIALRAQGLDIDSVRIQLMEMATSSGQAYASLQATGVTLGEAKDMWAAYASAVREASAAQEQETTVTTTQMSTQARLIELLVQQGSTLAQAQTALLAEGRTKAEVTEATNEYKQSLAAQAEVEAAAAQGYELDAASAMNLVQAQAVLVGQDEALLGAYTSLKAAQDAAAAGYEEDTAAAGGFMGMLGGLTGQLGAYAAVYATIKAVSIASQLQGDEQRFADFGQVSSSVMSKLESDLNHTFGTGTDSAKSFFEALTPVTGALGSVEGGALSASKTEIELVNAQQLEVASGNDLKTSLAAIVEVQRDFHLGTDQTTAVTNALYDSMIRNSQGLQQTAQAYGLVNSLLQGLHPSLALVKTLVDQAAQAGSDSNRVLNEEARAVVDYTKGTKTANDELSRYNLQLTTVNGQITVVGASQKNLNTVQSDSSRQLQTLGQDWASLKSEISDFASVAGKVIVTLIDAVLIPLETAFGTIEGSIGKVLTTASHIPGFGWAKDLGHDLEVDADKTIALNSRILHVWDTTKSGAAESTKAFKDVGDATTDNALAAQAAAERETAAAKLDAEAQAERIRGHAGVAAIIDKEAAATRAGDTALVESLQNQITVERAREEVATQTASDTASLQAKYADYAAKGYTDAAAKIQEALTDVSNGNLTAAKQAEQAAAAMASADERIASGAKSAATETLAATKDFARGWDDAAQAHQASAAEYLAGNTTMAESDKELAATLEQGHQEAVTRDHDLEAAHHDMVMAQLDGNLELVQSYQALYDAIAGGAETGGFENQIQKIKDLQEEQKKAGDIAATAARVQEDALHALSDAQTQYTKDLNDLTNVEAKQAGVVTQAQLSADQARLESARTTAAASLDAYQKAVDQLAAIAKSGSAADIKAATDALGEKQKAYETDLGNYRTAEQAKIDQSKAFEAQEKAEADAVKTAAADERSSYATTFDFIKTMAAGIGSGMAPALAQEVSAIQSTNSQILALDQELTQQLSADDRKAIEEKRTALQAQLSDEKQADTEIASSAKSMYDAIQASDKAQKDIAKALRQADLDDTVQKEQHKAEVAARTLDQQESQQVSSLQTSAYVAGVEAQIDDEKAAHAKNAADATNLKIEESVQRQIAAVRQGEAQYVEAVRSGQAAATAALTQQLLEQEQIEVSSKAKIAIAEAGIEQERAKIALQVARVEIEAATEVAKSTAAASQASATTQVANTITVGTTAQTTANTIANGFGAAYAGAAQASQASAQVQVADLTAVGKAALAAIQASQTTIESFNTQIDQANATLADAGQKANQIQQDIQDVASTAGAAIQNAAQQADDAIQGLQADAKLAQQIVSDQASSAADAASSEANLQKNGEDAANSSKDNANAQKDAAAAAKDDVRAQSDIYSAQEKQLSALEAQLQISQSILMLAKDLAEADINDAEAALSLQQDQLTLAKDQASLAASEPSGLDQQEQALSIQEASLTLAKDQWSMNQSAGQDTLAVEEQTLSLQEAQLTLARDLAAEQAAGGAGALQLREQALSLEEAELTLARDLAAEQASGGAAALATQEQALSLQEAQLTLAKDLAAQQTTTAIDIATAESDRLNVVKAAMELSGQSTTNIDAVLKHIQQVRALQEARQAVVEDPFKAQEETLRLEHDRLAVEQAQVAQAQDQFAAQEEALKIERDRLAVEKAQQAQSQDAFAAQEETLKIERDRLAVEKAQQAKQGQTTDPFKAQEDLLKIERDRLALEKAQAAKTQDPFKAQEDALRVQEEQLKVQKDLVDQQFKGQENALRISSEELAVQRAQLALLKDTFDATVAQTNATNAQTDAQQKRDDQAKKQDEEKMLKPGKPPAHEPPPSGTVPTVTVRIPDLTIPDFSALLTKSLPPPIGAAVTAGVAPVVSATAAVTDNVVAQDDEAIVAAIEKLSEALRLNATINIQLPTGDIVTEYINNIYNDSVTNICLGSP